LAQIRKADRRNVMEWVATLSAELSRAIPTGLFDRRALDRFLIHLFSAPGRSNDFRELRHKLFVIATHLDSGAPTTFGGVGFDHIPITDAIEASAALPGVFPPVNIDGAHYVDGALNKTLHASVALEAGVRLLLCVNALVPFAASPRRGHVPRDVDKLAHGGLPRVLAQTFRAIIHSRMEVGMDRYHAQYPDADILLFEPDRDDADMFLASIFSFARRNALCEAAFRKTRQSLFARRAVLEPLLARHRIRLKVEVLSDHQRSIRAALIDTRPLKARKPGVHQAARDLSYTLDQLDAWLVAPR
jgi:predicted acylesterase/phospholipase RssA